MTSYYSVGTVTLVTGSKTVSGNGTAWQTALITGGNIIVEAAGNVLPIATVVDDDTITAELAWTGASGTYNYAIQRDTAYLKTLDTNSQNLAYLLSELRQGTIFKYDVAGPDSDRNIYDTKPKGFSYLSTDGANPQLYVKLSATSGDWAGPFAYGTGPVGPAPTLAVAATNTLSPGASATVSITGSDGDYDLTFGIPAGLTGINNRGTYSAGTAYALRDGVLYNGSYWYATQSTTGNAPPASASTTSNTWWQLVAAKGTDGTGTGDVVGPSSAVSGRVAAFNDATGKSLSDGGKLVSDLVTGPATATANQLASFSSATGKVIADSGLLVSDVAAGIAGNVKFNGSQTLTAAQQAQARTNIAANLLSGLRNKIINPLGNINQRGVSGTVTLAAGTYGHDRFRAGASGCTYTFATSNGVTTFTITAGSLQQVIEASAFAGEAGTYFLGWVGTSQGRINSGSYGASGNVSATCDGSANVTVEWNTGTLSLPQFERSYVGTFFNRIYEQSLCERYYEVLPSGLFGPQVSGQNSYVNWFFKTTKRANPSIGGTLYLSSSITYSDIYRVQVLNATQNPGLSNGTATAEL